MSDNSIDDKTRADSVKTTLGLLPVIALSAALTAPANAQNVTELDTINVEGGGTGTGTGTGYKRERLQSKKATAELKNTPKTVTVIPEEVIKEQGARNLTEVLRNTPGITFDAGENGFATSTNNFKMRGFDGSGNVFIDGARDSGSYARDTFNVEQVEVVKGAAAENGRGGPGGYVNMATKTPTLDKFIKGEAEVAFDEYGTDPRKRATFDVNEVVGDFAVRFNGMVEHGGVMGRDIAEAKAWGLAPSIAYGLGTDLRVTLAYEHLERRDRPDWGVPGSMIKGMVNYDPVAATARRDSYFGLRSDFDDVTSDSLLARLEYDINDSVTVTNQTRWSRVDREARYTVPFGYDVATQDVTTQTQFYDRLNATLTNQTNLLARFETGTWKHTLAAGLEFTRETSDALRFGTQDPGNAPIFNPNPDRHPGFPMAATQSNDVSIDTVSAYIYDTIEFNEQWQLSGGLRAERYQVDIASKTVPGGLPAPGSLDGYSESETTLGGSLGVVYKPTPDGSIYASYGLSTLPPGSYLSNPDISRTGDNAFPGFVAGAKPVQSHNYEVGVKWDVLGGGLSVGAAVFRTEKHNVPWTGRAAGETVDTLKGYGKQIVQGVEFSVAGKVTDVWSVFGGVAFLKSERKHDPMLDVYRKNANGGDYGAATSTVGDELAFTPKVTANLWSTYDINEKLTIGGGMQYVGSSWLGRPDDANRVIPNGRFGKLPSYFLAHAMVSYNVNDNVKLRFNIDNIFNETHAVSSNWPGTRVSLGAPRTFRFSASMNF